MDVAGRDSGVVHDHPGRLDARLAGAAPTSSMDAAAAFAIAATSSSTGRRDHQPRETSHFRMCPAGCAEPVERHVLGASQPIAARGAAATPASAGIRSNAARRPDTLVSVPSRTLDAVRTVPGIRQRRLPRCPDRRVRRSGGAPRRTADVAATVREIEAAEHPRWVFEDSARACPPLLAEGVRVQRSHDLRLTGGAARHARRAARTRTEMPVDDRPGLFDAVASTAPDV